MRKVSERTQQLIEGYMTKRKEGMPNDQIAAYYGVTMTTLYNHLQKIADRNGVTRESLLEFPSKACTKLKKEVCGRKETVNPEQLKEKFNDALNKTSETIEKINQFEKEQEEK